MSYRLIYDQKRLATKRLLYPRGGLFKDFYLMFPLIVHKGVLKCFEIMFLFIV